MEIVAMSVGLAVLSVLMAAVVMYTYNMTKDLNIFERIGVPGPPPYPILGNFGLRYWMDGIFKFQKDMYRQYKDRKFYGVFEANVPVLHVRDFDTIHDVLVTHFDHFVDRPNQFKGDQLMDRCVPFLQGDQWRKTRQMLSSLFNREVLQMATSVMQRTSDALITYLKPKIDWHRRVDLSDIAMYSTIDVHTGIVFGGDYKTFERLNAKNAVYTEQLLSKSRVWRLAPPFFPFMAAVLGACGISVVPRRALKFCNKRVEEALQKSKKNGDTDRRRWISDLLAATSELHSGVGRKGAANYNANGKLVKTDIQAHAFTFLHSGLEKVSNILSFTLFQLANHPDCCQIAQDEIDDIIGARTPDENNIQHLQFLDMCIRETMRLYPHSIAIDRICRKEITLRGVRIPENMVVRIPVYALHHDPTVWAEPEEFHPERFDVDELEPPCRHPCAFLPFGLGPRGCLGEQLALMELKMILVHVLRVVTPFPCPKTVFPFKLGKWNMAPQDELWVKFRPRYWTL